MQSYRDRYEQLQGQSAQILAISADKEAKQAEFKRQIGADFAFVSDPKAEIIGQFGVKMPLIKLAKRATFVIGKDRTILAVEQGSKAISSSGAAEACKLF